MPIEWFERSKNNRFLHHGSPLLLRNRTIGTETVSAGLCFEPEGAIGVEVLGKKSRTNALCC